MILRKTNLWKRNWKRKLILRIAQDESLEEELEAKAYSPDNKPVKYKLYNLFYDAKGSHKYQGEWNQLDHIIVNGALLQENQALHVQKDS